MSNWTHVAAVVRIDGFRFDEADVMNFDEVFGKECLWGAPSEVWADAREHPEKYLPIGSEGTLEKSVWVNPKMNHATAYTVTIFGDLRDHDSPHKVLEWFKSKLDGLWIRQAVITIENELNGTLTWSSYDEEEKE